MGALEKMEHMEHMEYINIGCGHSYIQNAVNMDSVKNEWTHPDVVGNLLDIPFPEKRFEGVILSHVLEHLPKHEHGKALLEIRRVLKPNGKLYLEVPDFVQVMKNYISNHLGKREYWYNAIFGRVLYEDDRHLSGITEQYLTDLLFEYGFKNLKWKNSSMDVAFLRVLALKVEVPVEVSNGGF